MNREAWMWIAVGAAGLLVLVPRQTLGSPIEGDRIRVTPHGDFGAPRKGPPAHTHQGLDLVAKPGSLVLAIGDGAIVSANPGLGKIVRKLRLDRPSAWQRGARLVTHVVYADLGEPLVRPGARVRRGEAIARVGSAGFVHFAVKHSHDGHEEFFNPREAGLVPSSETKKGST